MFSKGWGIYTARVSIYKICRLWTKQIKIKIEFSFDGFISIKRAATENKTKIIM